MAKFTMHIDLQERGIRTIFKWHRFTVDASIHKKWSNIQDYLKKYELVIAPQAQVGISSKANAILNDLQQNTTIHFSIEANKGERYQESGKTQYIRCVFDKSLLEYIKRLFISTIVYESKGKSLPRDSHETMDLEFDTASNLVTLTNIKLYEPDDPYFDYARNAVYTLSVEAIGIGDYTNDEEKIKDFYEWNSISGWKERKNINKDKALVDKAGIYMLYDEANNDFYVGKAIDLHGRIIQHMNNVSGNDPIPNFTHYRYSLINMEYYEFLYLIENAAIHDCAMILDMPKASKLNKPLAKIANNLNDCRIVNTHERQRKKEK